MFWLDRFPAPVRITIRSRWMRTVASTVKRLGRDRLNVIGRDTVLPAVGKLLVEMRRSLGESSGSLQRFNVPIQQATTDSLDALNAFRVGLDLRSRGKQPDAIPFFKAAILLDTRFAKAYEQAGSVYYNLGEQELGARYLQKAFDLRARVTEPERFLITGRYFDIVTGQVEKALEVYSLWQKTYPLDWLPFNESANDAKLIGRYETGIREAREAMRLEPNHAFAYANLAISLMGVNRFSDASVICHDALKEARDGSELRRAVYELAFLSGDPEQISKATALIRNDIDVSASEALAAAARGKIAEAKRLLAENATQARTAGFPGAAAYPLGLEALILADVGEREEGRTFCEHGSRREGREHRLRISSGCLGRRRRQSGRGESRPRVRPRLSSLDLQHGDLRSFRQNRAGPR